ncbi:hypothetical protein PFISCL1PPCAC_24268 [Pristionchus fissidentatus]|uniref:Ankyrin repeat-containing protein n=1 Tax=Pristionchus fissidentatus TaxID=1538716 RepID=A0AAV5WL14_9BILA|nr:hypothetical protein PFISCL1PPCAC_24268 [Pristionchus fissidentatus]
MRERNKKYDRKRNSYKLEPIVLKAARSGNLEEVKKSIDDGFYVDRPDAGGRTALLEAVSIGHDEMVEFLLSKEANPNTCSFDGWTNSAFGGGITPLHQACKSGFTSIAHKLLSEGARVMAENADDWMSTDFLKLYIKENEKIISEEKMKECKELLEILMKKQMDAGYFRVSDRPLPNSRKPTNNRVWWNDVRRKKEEEERRKRRFAVKENFPVKRQKMNGYNKGGMSGKLL